MAKKDLKNVEDLKNLVIPEEEIDMRLKIIEIYPKEFKNSEPVFPYKIVYCDFKDLKIHITTCDKRIEILSSALSHGYTEIIILFNSVIFREHELKKLKNMWYTMANNSNIEAMKILKNNFNILPPDDLLLIYSFNNICKKDYPYKFVDISMLKYLVEDLKQDIRKGVYIIDLAGKLAIEAIIYLHRNGASITEIINSYVGPVSAITAIIKELQKRPPCIENNKKALKLFYYLSKNGCPYTEEESKFFEKLESKTYKIY
jgi:hypothetical protein